LRARQLLAEERIRVCDGPLESTRESLLERRLVVGPEDAAEEGVDGGGFVARLMVLNRRLDERADEFRLRLGRRRRSCRLHQDERVHGIREVESQLERDHRARGVAHDVRPLDLQVPHQ
jgi:hypothetical protein